MSSQRDHYLSHLRALYQATRVFLSTRKHLLTQLTVRYRERRSTYDMSEIFKSNIKRILLQ